MVFRDTTTDGTVRLTGGPVGGGGGEPGPPGDPGANGTNGLNADMAPFQANGVLTAKIWPTAMYINRTSQYRLRATVLQRGSGSDLIVNIWINGVISTLGGINRPTIAAGSGYATDAAGVLLTLTAGQIITGVEVVQVGDAWSTLVVQLFEEV